MKNLKLQRELLQEISCVLGAKPGARQDALLCVLEILAELGRYQSATLYLCAGDELLRQAHVGAESPIVVGADSSIVAVLRSGQAAISRGDSQLTTAAGAQSQAIMPIRRGAVTVGALVLASHNAYAFGAAEMAMLKAIARRLAVFFATTGKHYLRNLGSPRQSDQSHTVTAAVA